MNHFKLMVGLLFASLVLISCQKEVLTPNITQEFRPETGEPTIGLRNGIPSFSSAEHYFTVLDQLSSMDGKGLDNWEISQGFTSFRTKANQALAEISTAKSAAEQQMLARKHHLLVKESRFGYTAKLDFGYAAISNEAGLFYIATTLNTVQEGHLIAIEGGDLEKLDQAMRDPANYEGEGVYITKNPAAKFTQACGDFVFGENVDNNYRVVIVLASKSETVNQLGLVFARSKVDLGLQADVHEGAGIWSLDNTEVFANDIEVEVETITGAHTTFSLDDLHYHGGKGFLRTYVGEAIMYPLGTISVPETTMITARGKAYSKRMGENYPAVINCQ